MEGSMSRKIGLVLAVAAGLALAFACRKPAKTILTKDQRTRIEGSLLKQAPTPKSAVNAQFGEGVKLIGLDIAPERAKAGDPVTITWYWECTKETPGDWKVFGHLELPGGKRMILDHTPVGELYPIGQWKPGEIVKDEQKVVIDAEAKVGTATLWAGIFSEEIYRERGSGDRMPIKNKDKVANDGDNRAKVLTFGVDAGAASAAKPAPTLKAARTAGAIAIDGKADEADWANAAPATLGMADGRPADAASLTTVKALFDDQNVYFAFKVLDGAIEATFKNRDDELWTQDAVEIYLDANADGVDYVELQVSPANVVFDALFKTHRTPDWKEARSFTLDGMKTAVTVRGTLNQAGDADTGYDVEVAIPFASIPGFKPVPPAEGASIRVNFFRMDARDGKIVGAQAFSPAGGDFHDMARAGKLELGAPKAAAAPATTPAATPAPAEAAKSAPAATAAGAPRVNIDPAILRSGQSPARATRIAPIQPAPGAKTP
jgi:uncharacterized lipoprotein NlpE involved in copper resistance